VAGLLRLITQVAADVESQDNTSGWRESAEMLYSCL